MVVLGFLGLLVLDFVVLVVVFVLGFTDTVVVFAEDFSEDFEAAVDGFVVDAGGFDVVGDFVDGAIVVFFLH